MRNSELKELLERATSQKDDIVWENARYCLSGLSPTLAADLIRCRELLELAVICEDDYLTTSGAMPQEWYEKAKKYLLETEG